MRAVVFVSLTVVIRCTLACQHGNLPLDTRALHCTALCNVPILALTRFLSLAFFTLHTNTHTLLHPHTRTRTHARTYNTNNPPSTTLHLPRKIINNNTTTTTNNVNTRHPLR